MRSAGKIKAVTLILNGAKDGRTDPDQAHILADPITRAGGEARAIVYPGVGHMIPVEKRDKDIDPFLDRVLGGPKATTSKNGISMTNRATFFTFRHSAVVAPTALLPAGRFEQGPDALILASPDDIRP
jgi:hypothetical protein